MGPLVSRVLVPLVGVPVVLIFWRTFEHGFGNFWTTISDPQTVHAFKLTLIIAAWFIVRLYSASTALVFVVVILDSMLLAIGERRAVLIGAILNLSLALVLESLLPWNFFDSAGNGSKAAFGAGTGLLVAGWPGAGSAPENCARNWWLAGLALDAPPACWNKWNRAESYPACNPMAIATSSSPPATQQNRTTLDPSNSPTTFLHHPARRRTGTQGRRLGHHRQRLHHETPAGKHQDQFVLGDQGDGGQAVGVHAAAEVAAELGRTLDSFQVPDQEKGEVLAAFAAHKDEVTEGYTT